MKLKKLLIHGFKSFKDRTTIEFDHGITGIVGPNGCGKSNIVDALFWVMGEQSAKHLRGTSMQDLIFSGSSQHSPGTWAEVTLVLENDEQKYIQLGNSTTQPSEIQLTRKLYRNGESDYRINGVPSRLRDIQEVFMDTGSGAKSYSIIAQGEIARLVQSKPVERRTIIEEVAGITKFKARKKESLRKLEKTQENLNRLSDLQSEVEKNLKNLETQVEKARRAQELKEQIETNELLVQSHKLYVWADEFQQKQQQRQENQEILEESHIGSAEKEASLQEFKQQREALGNELEEAQQNFNEFSRQHVALTERASFLEQQQEDLLKQQEQREQEKLTWNSEWEERQQKYISLQAEWESLGDFNQEQVELKKREEAVEERKISYETFKQDVLTHEESLAQQKQTKEAQEKELFQLASKKAEHSRLLEETSQELEALEEQYSTVSMDMGKSREELAKTEQEVQQEEQKIAAEKERFIQLKQDRQSKELELQKVRDEFQEKKSELTILQNLKHGHEGVKAGARDFLQEHMSSFVLVGEHIQCKPEYASAVEVLLTPYLEMLMAKDNENFELSFDWWKQKQQPLTFLSPSNENWQGDFQHSKKVIPLKEILIESSLPESFFEGFYLIEQLHPEDLSQLEGVYKGIAACDGTIAQWKDAAGGKQSYLAGKEEQTSFIARNNQIALLEKALPGLEAQQNQETEKLEGIKICLQEKDTLIEGLRQQLLQLRTDFSSQASALKEREKFFESVAARVEVLKNRRQSTSEAKLATLEQESLLEQKQQALISSFTGYEAALVSKKEELTQREETYHQSVEEYRQQKISCDAWETKQKAVKEQLEDLEYQREKLQEKISQNQNYLNDLSQTLNETQTQSQELTTELSDCEQKLEESQQFLAEKKVAFDELNYQLEQTEQMVKEFSATISRLEKENLSFDLRLEQILEDEEQLVRNIFEKHQIDLRAVISPVLNLDKTFWQSFTDLAEMYFIETEHGRQAIETRTYEFSQQDQSEVKQKSQQLKKDQAEFARIGEVNWQALEDYQRQKARFDFLSEQAEELSQSVEDLSQAISHIDEKSKLRFREAFESVNTKFTQVFPLIFGGGHAELKVVGDLNDVECGIDIHAQPPGKRMQNINLMSGGEKAMTALSLIFAIFLVKPSPFCLLDEVDAPLDDANVGRFNDLLREMSSESQFILITHNKKTMELNNCLYGVTMQEPGISTALSVELQ